MTTFEGVPPGGKPRPIGGEKVSGKEQASRQKGARKPDGAAQKPDTVKLSGKAKELSGLMESMENLPEVREDKVKALKEAIESGNYKPDSKKIAGKIIDEVV